MTECPVCSASAANIAPSGHDGEIWRCDGDCKDFEVTGQAARKFYNLGQSDRAEALDRARRFKHPSQQRPAILERYVR